MAGIFKKVYDWLLRLFWYVLHRSVPVVCLMRSNHCFINQPAVNVPEGGMVMLRFE